MDNDTVSNLELINSNDYKSYFLVGIKIEIYVTLVIRFFCRGLWNELEFLSETF